MPTLSTDVSATVTLALPAAVVELIVGWLKLVSAWMPLALAVSPLVL